MSDAAPKAQAVSKALEQILRRDRGRLLAGLITRLGDFQLAEDALQEAVLSAMGHWADKGLPDRPAAWLMRVAHNKGIDRHRATAREGQKASDWGLLAGAPDEVETSESIPDERLRLIFACCHPALDEKSRVALTLRIVCNLTTREIAKAFLDQEATMGQRLSRAKASIKAKGISFSVPDADLWDSRLDTVLSTIYLIYTTGYVSDDNGPRALCKEALFLVDLLAKLRPGTAEIEGAQALMQLSHARRAARVGQDGALVPVGKQDASLWDDKAVKAAQGTLARALVRGQPGPYQIKAALADCAMMRPNPDWVQMSLLYQSLWAHEPTPVVALNWAVALAECGHLSLALEKVQALGDELHDFQPYHAALAELLSRSGAHEAARFAYQRAIESAPNEASRLFLEKRLSTLPQ